MAMARFCETSTSSYLTERERDKASLYMVSFQQRIWKIAKGGKGPGGRHFTQGGRSTVVIGGTLRRNFLLLEGARGRPQAGKAPGGTFRRWRAPEDILQLHVPCKTFTIGGRQTIAKGAEGAQGPRGAMAQWPPCPRPCFFLSALKAPFMSQAAHH